jgi:hypothetical protein
MKIAAMIPSPLPYNPRWTVKLLRHGIYNLKFKAISEVKARFVRPSKPSTENVGIAIAEPKAHQNIRSTASAADEVINNSDSLSDSQAPHFPPEPNTLYELLEEQLRTLWAVRDRSVSHKERWQFRGSWLVLWNAVQACPSNPCYDICEGPRADETALLLQLLKLGAVKASRYALRVSKMPATPYEGSKNRIRYDSVFSTFTSGGYVAPKPSTSQLWHSILEGVTDESRTTSVAEELLMCIWPGKNAAEVVDAIRDPSKTFVEADELRLQLRDLLFPASTALPVLR